MEEITQYKVLARKYRPQQFKDLVDLAENGLKDLFVLQKKVINNGWKTTKKNF